MKASKKKPAPLPAHMARWYRTRATAWKEIQGIPMKELRSMRKRMAKDVQAQIHTACDALANLSAVDFEIDRRTKGGAR